jgi:hypothetical protein
VILVVAAIGGIVGASVAAADGTAAPRPDAAERKTVGWIKAFAAEPVAAGASFEAPDYLGSVTEQAVREEIQQRLSAKGFKPAPAGSASLITVSVSVTEPKPKTRGLPKSPVRLEGVDRDPTDNIHDPEVRPYIAFPAGKPAPAATPEIKVTLYARRGDTRIWSGYAGAPAIGASREDIARSLGAALIEHFGQTADLPEAEIALAPDAAASPIVELHQ